MPETGSKFNGKRAGSGPPRVLIVLAIVSVAVPFLVWRGTWFGRTLSSQQIDAYLEDTAHPRKIQHALTQVSEKILRGESDAEEYYSRVATLARHQEPAVRTTAAWVMGQDNKHHRFHETLLDLLDDPDLMVRRNAALSLVRFADPRGRMELVRILQPFEVRSPVRGAVDVSLEPGQRVGMKSLLARVKPTHGGQVEVRAPFAGTVSQLNKLNGERVSADEQLLVLEADADQVWESLRGLFFVGRTEDLPVVTRFEREMRDMPGHIRQQATLTARAIRTRSEPAPNR